MSALGVNVTIAAARACIVFNRAINRAFTLINPFARVGVRVARVNPIAARTFPLVPSIARGNRRAVSGKPAPFFTV